MKKLIALCLVIWACFTIDGIRYSGAVDHFEKDYTEEGCALYWIYMGNEEYAVPQEDLYMALYDEKGQCEVIWDGSLLKCTDGR